MARQWYFSLFLALALIPFAGQSGVPAPAVPKTAPVVYYDLTGLYKLDLKDPAQRRRFWDETHLLVSLQGLANRHAPRLYLRYIREPDDFWWNQMTQPGGWLAGREVVRISNLEELLERFQDCYKGVVVWDERVPSTSNLASTIAGCDDLLCLRYDVSANSLYQRLTQGQRRLPVRVRLLQNDGSPMFTGVGTIPGTRLATSGSAKADAYLWLVEHYLKTGKADPHRMGYYLDAFWLQCWNAGSPENHTLSNHDFVIARRGVLFDLNVWDDEACVDDPRQKPGTDVAMLKTLLRAAYDQFKGEGVIHVAGFVPWAYKYTRFKKSTWAAGGQHEEVATEWRYAEILSCFNAFMDADALGLGAMANASFFQHYPLAVRYPQNPKPTRASLIARGLLDAQGHIVPRTYVAHYVGDYDAAAWLYRELPKMWSDPTLGATPLSWAFNPNLSERFPLGMAWARERRSSNDWFVAGDSGAGYLNPGYLTPPRIHSGLPSGLAAWEQHCQRLFAQWDLSLTGFVIDGYAPGLSPEGLNAYARFSGDGIVGQKIGRQGVHNCMPYLRMRTDLDGAPAQVANTIHQLSQGAPPRFLVCRSILKTPTWYFHVDQELQRLAGDKVKLVDLYTLLWLVREYETNPGSRPVSPYAHAREISVCPDHAAGLTAISAGDGQFTLVDRAGTRCWMIPSKGHLYLDVDDQFFSPAKGPVEIELSYLDAGSGRLTMQYDSTDPKATMKGAYKAHQKNVNRTATGQWRNEVFRVTDARFSGSQNHEADFRFHNNGDALLIRSVTVRISKSQ